MHTKVPRDNPDLLLKFWLLMHRLWIWDEMTLASVIDDKNYDVGGGKTIKGSKGDVSMRTLSHFLLTPVPYRPVILSLKM